MSRPWGIFKTKPLGPRPDPAPEPDYIAEGKRRAASALEAAARMRVIADRYNHRLNDLLGKHVRVYLNHGGGLHAEGEVIGIIYEPALIIRPEVGTDIAVSSSLRREVDERPLTRLHGGRP